MGTFTSPNSTLLLFHLFAMMSVATVNLEPSGVLQLCPGSNITFVCTNNQTSVLAWRSFEQLTYPKGDPHFFRNNSKINMEYFSGSFAIVLISASPLVSTATLTSNFGSQLNGTNLTCSSTTYSTLPPTEAEYAVLILKDPPSTPSQPKLCPKSLTSAVLSWIPSTESLCVTSYTVNLTNVTEGNASYTYNTTTNTTNMTVSDLTQGVEYFFTVAGVDAEGRVGESSNSSSSVMLDTPVAVTGLEYDESYGSDNVIKIRIKWMPPSSFTRPHVTGYNVSHNASGTVKLYETNETKFVLESTFPSLLVLAVAAVNVLGVGEESDITINIKGRSPSNSIGSLSNSTVYMPTISSMPTDVQNINIPYQVLIPSAIATAIIFTLVLIVISVLCMKKSGRNCTCKKSGDTENIALAVTSERNNVQGMNLYDTTMESLSNFRPLPPEPTDETEGFSEHVECSTPGGPMQRPVVEEESTYSRLTGAHKQPQFLPPLDDGTYSKLNITSKLPSSSPDQVNPKDSATSHYAVLGERRKDAPIILPPEQAVVYTTLRSNVGGRANMSDSLQHPPGGDLGSGRLEQSAEATEAVPGHPPPLPPKGLPNTS